MTAMDVKWIYGMAVDAKAVDAKAAAVTGTAAEGTMAAEGTTHWALVR